MKNGALILHPRYFDQSMSEISLKPSEIEEQKMSLRHPLKKPLNQSAAREEKEKTKRVPEAQKNLKFCSTSVSQTQHLLYITVFAQVV